MQIEVEVKGQRIKRINSPGSVEDTLNYLTCHFTFDGAEWDNTVKTAYFQNPASGEKHPKILADDGTCTVPWEALTDKGFVRFSVAGERDGYRITTGIESFYNSETVYGGNPSEPPTPDQYDQLIALAEQTKEIAESVRSDADAGKFDGEPGKPGDPGKDGVSPAAKVEETNDGAVITVTDATGTTKAKLKNGKDGNPGQDATDEQVQAAVDAYMEEHPIQGDTEDIIKLAIKNEASGAVPISITDSADMGVQDLEMQGWTEQAQYEGNQLFNKDSCSVGLLEADGSVNEVSSANYRTTDYIPVNSGMSYTCTKTGSIRGKYFDTEKEPLQTINFQDFNFSAGGEITIPDDVYYIRFSMLEENLETVMLNEGSTALPYEPYTGGQPSPNPDYPQEIVSAGKYDEGTGKYEYELKLTGANLFNPANLTGGEIVEYNGVQCYKYTDNAINFTYVDDFAENTQYCFSVMVLSSEGNEEKATNMFIVYTDGIRSTIYLSYNQLMNVVSSANKTVAMITGNDNWSVARYIDLTMTTLGIGTEPVPYQPYKEQTVILTADRPLTKWDRLEKRNGVWGWMYKSGKKVIDGTETYFASGYGYISEKSSNAYINNNDMVKGIPNLKNGHCNRLTHVDVVWATVDSIGFCYNQNQIHMRISNDSLGTTSESTSQEVISAMKNYMSQQYNDGNPFVFWYETAEETFVPLSESEQEQMNELYTFRPTTVLSNDCECEMSIKYIADTKAYIDSKISAIQAAIVNTI